jgi:ankyrin repeat protein
VSKALKAAIETNDPVAIQKALKTVKDLSRKLPKGEPPLIYACQIGADAAVAPLLEAGAPIQGRSEHESNHPLSVAAEHGRVKVIEKLASRPIPEKVINHVLFSATLDGKEEIILVLLERLKPAIPLRVLEVSTWWQDGRIFKLLVEHGADVNMVNDGKNNYEQRGETAMHDVAGSGHVEAVRLLASHGAKVNARDAYGRTPLMHVAYSMARLDQEKRMAEERAKRVLTEAQKALQAKLAAQTRRHGDRAPADGMAAARLLLELGADASLKDTFGNDAIMHYEWERRRSREPLNEEFLEMLKTAGAQGGGATAELFWAIQADDLGAARRAIDAGADVNHAPPMPVSTTPLIMARSTPMLALLLERGADPNKPSESWTPLIANVGRGLEAIKMLVEAGADIHAIQPGPPGSEYVANAYSSALMNRHHEVADYLKSLGAGNPVRQDWKPLTAGVHMWENFSEVVANGDVPAVSAAVAKVINGKVHPGVYGKALAPGKNTFVVLRPKAMQWCNLMQISPPPSGFDWDEKQLAEIAKALGAPVLLIQYSDAAGAGDVKRFQPDGKVVADEGYDRESLEEMVSAMGDEAPDWAKKRLAELEQSDEEDEGSSERIVRLAESEKFAIAWGGLRAEPGRNLEIEFTNLPAEAFDGAAWVSD